MANQNEQTPVNDTDSAAFKAAAVKEAAVKEMAPQDLANSLLKGEIKCPDEMVQFFISKIKVGSSHLGELGKSRARLEAELRNLEIEQVRTQGQVDGHISDMVERYQGLMKQTTTDEAAKLKEVAAAGCRGELAITGNTEVTIPAGD